MSVDGGSTSTLELETKRCPRCGERLFRDMDVCYGCLYEFGRQREQELAAAGVPNDFVLREVVEQEIDEGDVVLEEEGTYDLGMPDFAELGLEGADLGAPCLMCLDGGPGPGPSELAEQGLPQGWQRIWLRTDSVDVILPLPREGMVFGADLSCDVVLHSAAVSPRHLRVIPAEGGALAFDLDAAYPALRDGVPVGEGTLVLPGESVVLCGSIATLVGPPVEDGCA